MTMTLRRGDHHAPSRRSPIPPQEAFVAPGASYAVALDPIDPEHASTAIRLWKCRPYGNHKTVSTAPWKSRTEREIPTFPQPIIFFFINRKNGEGEERNASASHMTRASEH